MKRNTASGPWDGKGDETGSSKKRSSRIPSPSRTPATYTRRSSQASTPQRSRSSSQSPTRAGVISPTYSSRSLENISPIRLQDARASRSNEHYPVESSGRNLVRYITVDMIRRLAKEEQLEHIKSLTFSLSGEKKIRYIENLEGLKNLTALSLNGNVVQRIEKIDHLVNLRQLHLAGNKIEKIEGLETLVNLQVLNLEDNLIERIPLWLVKKLRCLRTVRLAANNISSLTDIVRLRGLHDLHVLTIAGNPLCELPHHRPYVIFHLRMLNQLDDVTVTSSERSNAASRFSQEELDRLTRDLQNTSTQLEQSQDLHNRSLEELEMMLAKEREMEDREARALESREEMERELDTKDDMLKRKAKELQRAQAKQYQLEQELAFMKLDAKFQPLDVPHADSGEDADSPYLGKSRFKRNEYAMEGNIPSNRQQFKIMDDHSRRQLDEQLSEKQRQLNEAAERLAGLQRELRDTQKQVMDASRELNKLEQAATARRLTEAEKQKLRQRLAAKIQGLNQMREHAEMLEDDLARSRSTIPLIQAEQDDLRSRMAAMDPNSPEYGQVANELLSKESHVQDLTNQIHLNEATLDKILKNIAVDTDAIKQLEEQLKRGTTSTDDTLRQELEDIVRGLQDYLINVRQKADAQRVEFDNLLRDKERLVRKLAMLEQEKSLLMADADDYTQLQQQISVLGDLNNLLQATQDLNESILNRRSFPIRSPEKREVLPAHLQDAVTQGTATASQLEEATRLTLDALNKSMTEMQNMNNTLQDEATQLSKHDSELQTQLQEAQNRVESLHKSVQDSDRRSKSDQEQLNEQMEKMAKLQNQVEDRESEAAALRKEVGKLKKHNRDLAHATDARSQQYQREMASLLQPHDVAQRIAHLGDALRRGNRDVLDDLRNGDIFHRALRGLGNVAFDLVDKGNQDKEKAEKALQALEKHVASLKKKLLEAQKEYKETMEAATAAKLDAEKRKHENALRHLDDDMRDMRERLREAEEDAELLRALAHQEKERREEEMKDRDERARFYDAHGRLLGKYAALNRDVGERKNTDEIEKKLFRSQATIRDLEMELGVTRRDMRDKEATTNKELLQNRAKIQALHRKLQKLEEERDNDLLTTMDAEATAARALGDLANAEEEIKLLEDLLRAHEKDPNSYRGRNTVHRLRDTLRTRQGEVDRLRRALRGRKLTPEQIDDLLDDVSALRDALTTNQHSIRALWPGYYYCVPDGGKWVFTGSRSKRQEGPPPPPPQLGVVQGIPMDPSRCMLEPGNPGVIAVQEDGSLVLVPFEGFYCNVPEHHDLEDEVAALKEALEKSKEKRKASKMELQETIKLVGPLEEGEGRLEELKELIQSHEEVLRKLKNDEEEMAKEKAETMKELADLKDTLSNKLQRKHQLEDRVENLLGELRTEEALLQRDEMTDELESLERTLSKRRAELRDAERLLREAREGADRAEEKAETMSKRFEKVRNDLHVAEQDAEELERQASDTGTKLVRARSELRQLQEQVKEAEGRRIQLDDQCRQLARLVTNKEAEFTALEQKTDHMTGSLERLQSELILAEEKEAERLTALRESEKVLSERREELNKLKDQAMTQRDEVEGLDRMLGKKKTELQLLQENIEQHQTELSNVLKEGKTDVLEKQKQIKLLRHEVDDLSSTKSDLEAQISRRRSELVSVRESSEKASEDLQNRISEVNRQKSELKHVLEMLGLEQQELDSLKRQHESKSVELAETQHRLLEERTELDRIITDVQRKESELSKVKQTSDKHRSDVDCLTSQRSTLEDTVRSLMKEKDMLSNTAASLEDKIQLGKKNLHELRVGIEKSGSTLDEMERELSQVRREAHEANLKKTTLNKEITSMSSSAKDLRSEISSYKSELQDTQDQLQLVDQDLRAATKQRDEVTMEVISLREELKSHSHEMELLGQQLKRRREEAQRAEDNARDRRDELAHKEREIDRLNRELERQEEKLSRTIADLNADIQRLQGEVVEQRDELESTIIKRDAIKRDMERLGRLEEKYEETENQIGALKGRLTERERELLQAQRERSDLKGALASTEGEFRATKVEADHEIRRLQEKVEESKLEMERLRSRSAEEIGSLEEISQEHCERATRLAAETNELRVEQLRLKKEIRFLEEERENERLQLQRSARRIRTEIDNKVEESVNLLDTSHHEAVEDMKDLYHMKESNQNRLNALKEIQRSRSPRRSYGARKEERAMQNLQEDLKAKQEEITTQIRRQMNRHREQWQARKMQSEGKLRSLKKKVDTLDELVSNTSMDSLSHSRGRDLSPSRVLPALEERENLSPPEREFPHYS